MTGDLPEVRLRPLTRADAGAIEAAMTAEDDPFNWIGHREPGWLVHEVEDRRTITDDGGRLAVVGPELLVGWVSWHRIRTGASPYSWCWNVGAVMLPAHRGQGFGSAAQRALAGYLFATTPAYRVEAGTEVGNLAEQRALDKAGFRREAVLRGYGWRDGEFRDGVLYSVLRGELGASS